MFVDSQSKDSRREEFQVVAGDLPGSNERGVVGLRQQQ
jgi:hypothetical protein